jgi:hypothetical protein
MICSSRARNPTESGHSIRTKAATLVVGVIALGDEPLNHVKPGSRGRREVPMEAARRFDPALHGWGLVSGIVVNDEMEIETGGGLLVDQFKKAQELAVTMARHASPDNPAVQHVQRRKQGGGADAIVVVGHGTGTPLLHGVDAQDQRLVGRIEIEPDHVLHHVLHLDGEVLVARDFEGLDQMRLEPVRTISAGHCCRRRPPPRPCGARSTGSQSAASGGLRLSAARLQPYPHSGAASAGPCSVIILAGGTRNSYSHHSGRPAGPPLSSQPPQSAAEAAHQGQPPAPQRATESPIHQHPNLISCRESSGNPDRKNSTRGSLNFRTRP